MQNLVVNGPICSTGYGVATYNICKQLINKFNLYIMPISNTIPIEYNDISESFLWNKSISYNSEYPSIKIWHQNDLFSHLSKTRRIGFPIFELDTFSDLEISSMSSCDDLFVCSQWAQQILDKYNLKSSVVPLGVDTEIFKPSSINRYGKTIFLNCGKWEIRKGHDILVNAFNQAFTHNDNVELWMMSDNIVLPEINEHWEKLYKTSKLSDKIKIIPYQATHKDVFNIMRQADCGVFPSRAEGWNLELLEMMACGKTVITTNYSAHTEYCTGSNALLINIDDLELANDGLWFHNNGFWASLGTSQFEQLVQHMRSVHQKKNENGSQSIVNQNGIITASKFSWANSAECIYDKI